MAFLPHVPSGGFKCSRPERPVRAHLLLSCQAGATQGLAPAAPSSVLRGVRPGYPPFPSPASPNQAMKWVPACREFLEAADIQSASWCLGRRTVRLGVARVLSKLASSLSLEVIWPHNLPFGHFRPHLCCWGGVLCYLKTAVIRRWL